MSSGFLNLGPSAFDELLVVWSRVFEELFEFRIAYCSVTFRNDSPTINGMTFNVDLALFLGHVTLGERN